MDWITIIEALLPLVSENVPGAAEDIELGKTALALIKRIKSQSGMTTDEILDRAGITLAQNKVRLAEEMERLGPGSGGGTGGGSGSGTGGGSGSGGNP